MVARQTHRHPKYEVTFADHQKKVQLNSLKILKITKAILHYESVDQAILSVVFVTHQKIKAFNEEYLKRNYVTDVLAFDLSDTVLSKRKTKGVIGDIIISTDAALKNVSMYQTTLSEELSLYIVHGILHLCGYDDHKSSDIQRMRKKEKKIVFFLGTKIRDIAQLKNISKSRE